MGVHTKCPNSLVERYKAWLVAQVVERYKARLVARVFSQQYKIDYDETFNLMAKLMTVRALLGCVASKK